jgi:hypothetical protein
VIATSVTLDIIATADDIGWGHVGARMEDKEREDCLTSMLVLSGCCLNSMPTTTMTSLERISFVQSFLFPHFLEYNEGLNNKIIKFLDCLYLSEF